jgi:putative transposase
MKRRRSYDIPGHAHELTFSCYRRSKLLASDRTRTWFIDALRAARDRHGFRLIAFVVMPEHAHVLLHPMACEGVEPVPIRTILQGIKQPVAQRAIAWLRANDPAFLDRLRIERHNGTHEHRFWQRGGGYDRNLWKPEALWSVVDYLHRNPVRRGLCERPTDWRWSSVRWYEEMDDVVLDVDLVPPGVLKTYT